MMMQDTSGDADTLAGALPDHLINDAIAVLKAADRCGSTAESCTGGLLASLLTAVEGVGHLFDGGVCDFGDIGRGPTRIATLRVAIKMLDEGSAY